MSQNQPPAGIPVQDWQAKSPSAQAPVSSLSAQAQRFQWLAILSRIWQDQRVRVILLTLYYLAIILALIVMYGRGDFSTPPFIYQGF